tara:strand:- start:358 stop:615 length:258 start_codon:yes stop_codon:yes gene_type:complete
MSARKTNFIKTATKSQIEAMTFNQLDNARDYAHGHGSETIFNMWMARFEDAFQNAQERERDARQRHYQTPVAARPRSCDESWGCF